MKQKISLNNEMKQKELLNNANKAEKTSVQRNARNKACQSLKQENTVNGNMH